MSTLLIKGDSSDIGWLWDELDSRSYLHGLEVDHVDWEPSDLLKVCEVVADRITCIDHDMWQEGLGFEDSDDCWQRLAHKLYMILAEDEALARVAIAGTNRD